MSPMLHKLQRLIKVTNPASSLRFDPPEDSRGNWWIDVETRENRITLEYHEGQGFGIFDPNSGYGEGPSEIYRTPELAARRVSQLLESGRGKRSRLTLKTLRELRGYSQMRLARKVGVQQAAISRFEKRAEVKISTLAAAVEALGGTLEVRARFKDADVAISPKA
jgi:DNA-binding XRE family transcriptional regulator